LSNEAGIERKRAIRSLTARLWVFALGSLGFGFALVPLYDVVCEVTGYGNKGQLAIAREATESAVPGRTTMRSMAACTSTRVSA
jgi:cytochrome c oxidase assembly protein Cox11